jgi:purine-cytosine permease-like protein
VLGALTIDLLSFQTFLLLLGSLFVPLFAVLLADWLVAGRRYEEADIFEAPRWRPGMVAVWAAGFALDQWLAPTGPGWWVELVGRLDPPSWGVGATIPSFAVTFVAALAVAAVSHRAAPRPVGA